MENNRWSQEMTEICNDDILDYFDKGKSILVSYKFSYDGLEKIRFVRINEKNHFVKKVKKIKNRILITVH
jgi:hypothetical protein